MENNPFVLLSDISIEEEALVEGGYSYTFYHDKSGEQGKLLIVGPHEGRYVSQPLGEKNSEAEKYLSILKPITTLLCNELQKTYGKEGRLVSPIFSLHRQGPMIASKIFKCQSCHHAVALLVFAKDAYVTAHLEDYAQLIYPSVEAMALPTWLIGLEQELTQNEGQALVSKLWPIRKNTEIMSSVELNALFHSLQQNHCASITQLFPD